MPLIGRNEDPADRRKAKVQERSFCSCSLKAHDYDQLHSITDVNSDILDSIFNFFSYYNGKENKTLELLGIGSNAEAHELINKAKI